LGEITLPSSREAPYGTEYNENPVILKKNFHFVLNATLIKVDDKHFVLRGEKLQHFEDMIARCIVDLRDKLANALYQMAFFNLPPMITGIGVYSAYVDQI